jgi:hypothetical protein
VVYEIEGRNGSVFTDWFVCVYDRRVDPSNGHAHGVEPESLLPCSEEPLLFYDTDFQLSC